MKRQKIILYLAAVLIGFMLAKFIFDFLDRGLIKEEKPLKPSIEKEIINISQKEEKSFDYKEPIPKISPENKRSSPETLKLTGILYESESENSYVLINNYVLKKGDCFKDYCVKDIFPDRVRLEYKDQIIELKI